MKAVTNREQTSKGLSFGPRSRAESAIDYHYVTRVTRAMLSRLLPLKPRNANSRDSGLLFPGVPGLALDHRPAFI